MKHSHNIRPVFDDGTLLELVGLYAISTLHDWSPDHYVSRPY